LIARTTAFWLGLCFVLVPLGAGVGALSRAVTVHRTQMTLIGGAVLVTLGIMTLSGKGFGLGAIQRASARISVSSAASVVALGAIYGLAGFCSGPLLGSVLTLSVMGADPAYGGFLMAVYALGMASPLFVLAWLWDRLKLSQRSWLRGRGVRIGPLQMHTNSLPARRTDRRKRCPLEPCRIREVAVRSMATANAGTLSKVTRVTRPLAISARTCTTPTAVSTRKCVTGATAGTVCVSSTAVTAHIRLLPDIGRNPPCSKTIIPKVAVCIHRRQHQHGTEAGVSAGLVEEQLE
jgi:hypothetical protein